MIYYTGIGSRSTPEDILKKMYNLGNMFSLLGFTLRSGGANGADTAFEKGATKHNGKKEIYLPWKNFNGNDSQYFNVNDDVLRIAKEVYGSRWGSLSSGVKSLMARNIYQVMGFDLVTPSNFVVCWTPDGAINHSNRTSKTGGTGQAIAYASQQNIPVFNLKNSNDIQLLLDFVEDLR